MQVVRLRASLKGVTTTIAMWVAISFLSAKANANTYITSLFEGQWRTDGQICAGFKQTDPFMDFGYNGDIFVSFGKVECGLKIEHSLTLVVTNKKLCAKNGFPTEYIGKYTLVKANKNLVSGHLLFENTKGEEQLLKDCRVHK
jgi:hypothetical protein